MKKTCRVRAAMTVREGWWCVGHGVQGLRMGMVGTGCVLVISTSFACRKIGMIQENASV